jgi:hypothetical protein
MVIIKINLVIIAANKIEPKVLMVEDNSLPSDIIYDTSIQLSAANLLNKYTGIQARINGHGWIDLKQAPIIEREEYLIIPFGCMIPETTSNLNNSKWVSVSKIFKQEIEVSKESLDTIQKTIMIL